MELELLLLRLELLELLELLSLLLLDVEPLKLLLELLVLLLLSLLPVSVSKLDSCSVTPKPGGRLTRRMRLDSSWAGNTSTPRYSRAAAHCGSWTMYGCQRK